MRHRKEILSYTRSIIKKLFAVESNRLDVMEDDIAFQNFRLNSLEGRTPPSLHEMEVREFQRREDEDARQDLCTDITLEAELTNKYGVTGWANKLIKEIIATRHLDNTNH